MIRSINSVNGGNRDVNRVIGGLRGNDLPRDQLLRNLRHGFTEVEQGNPAQQLNSPLRHFWLPFRAFVVDGLGGHEAVAEPLLVPPLSGKLLPRRFNDSWRWASGIETRDGSLNVDGLFGELCHVCKVMSLLLGERLRTPGAISVRRAPPGSAMFILFFTVRSVCVDFRTKSSTLRRSPFTVLSWFYL